ncbi:MAG: cytidine deaminase [Clostridiales bacterium]
MNIENLINAAIEARKAAYAPYSNFTVGAALLGKSEKIYTGCNVENAGFTPSICGERAALYTAIAQSERSFIAIAIVGGSEDSAEKDLDFCFPCGVCRQVFYEFCQADFQIIVAKNKDDYSVYTLKELLPHGFGPENLQK